MTGQSQNDLIKSIDFMVCRLSQEKTSFVDAVTKFQEFLKANKYSAEIVWVQPDDVLLTDKRLFYVRVSLPHAREKMAQQMYEEGIARQRGVLFRTICDLDGATGSHVWVPASDDEAARSLMPSGLKLSVQTDRIRGVP